MWRCGNLLNTKWQLSAMLELQEVVFCLLLCWEHLFASVCKILCKYQTTAEIFSFSDVENGSHLPSWTYYIRTWDHPRRVFDVIHCHAKFGQNLCTTCSLELCEY